METPVGNGSSSRSIPGTTSQGLSAGTFQGEPDSSSSIPSQSVSPPSASERGDPPSPRTAWWLLRGRLLLRHVPLGGFGEAGSAFATYRLVASARQAPPSPRTAWWLRRGRLRLRHAPLGDFGETGSPGCRRPPSMLRVRSVGPECDHGIDS